MAASIPSVPVRLSVAVSTLGQGQKYSEKVKKRKRVDRGEETAEQVTYLVPLETGLKNEYISMLFFH